MPYRFTTVAKTLLTLAVIFSPDTFVAPPELPQKASTEPPIILPIRSNVFLLPDESVMAFTSLAVLRPL